jgi:hypothetical protein
MKFTAEAKSLMESNPKPAYWYNNMSQEFYEFYEDVWGTMFEELQVFHGYYMETSARSGEGVVYLMETDYKKEPIDKVALQFYMAEELRLFFELVACGRFNTAEEIAQEMCKVYIDWVAEGKSE